MTFVLGNKKDEELESNGSKEKCVSAKDFVNKPEKSTRSKEST
jgi:hypothetical protein